MVNGRYGEKGYISSPHFPTVYPPDYSNQVQLKNIEAIKEQSINNSSSTGVIQLTFDDFALGSSSYMDVIYFKFKSELI